MKFSIITPTHNRPEKLLRAVESVMNQTYDNWELIIINDSPLEVSYNEKLLHLDDKRIHYHTNNKNLGVNFSRNRALDNVAIDSEWIIFLDDDDYLATDALLTFHKLVLDHQFEKWFLTNRAYANGVTITKIPNTRRHIYNYFWDYLFLKRIKGDATHCISKKLIGDIRFSKHIKQGEEWFFFYQIGLKSKMCYHAHNSTLSDGYDERNGLNFRKRSQKNRLETILVVIREGLSLKLISYLTFLIYLFGRVIQIIIKNH